MKFNSIEIRVVKNGYVVLESYSPSQMVSGGNMHVFEKFETLVEWMSRNLTTPTSEEPKP